MQRHNLPKMPGGVGALQSLGLILIILVVSLVSCQTEDDLKSTEQATVLPPTLTTLPTPSKVDDVLKSTDTPSPPTLTPVPGETAAPTPTATDTPSPTATSPPPEFAVTVIGLDPLVSGLTSPTYLTHAFDERLFVTEQGGTIRIIDDGRLLDEPFLDIINRVGSAAFEQGLLSVAFHSNYAESGQFYVNYTDRIGATIVSRFSVRSDDPNQADPESEEILLSVRQPFENHNGGQLQFGPDDMLYIGMGDGGSAGDPLNNGQDNSTLLGSLLRIDVSAETGYQIPFDNPFLDDPAIPDEIWSIGLRNPWRFSFDRKYGDLYLSDVGQSLLEEVNYIPYPSAGGQNFGWNIMEGANCFLNESCDASSLTIPAAQYSHQEGGCSITGGYVYRGANFQDLLGNYFYGDFCSGFIWSLLKDSAGEWASHLVAQSGFKISSFGEDAAGELYLADHASGTVYQVRP